MPAHPAGNFPHTDIRRHGCRGISRAPVGFVLTKIPGDAWTAGRADLEPAIMTAIPGDLWNNPGPRGMLVWITQAPAGNADDKHCMGKRS
jgi:hypothetical protein